MRNHAPTRTAGRMSAVTSLTGTRTAVSLLVLSAILAAAPATSQEIIENVQLNDGDIFAGQVLDVVDNYGLLQSEAQAAGNNFHGGNATVDATLSSAQSVTANVDANVTVNGIGAPEDYRNSLGTPLYVNSMATGNATSFVTQGANAHTDATQASTADHVRADAQINSENNSIYQSGEVRSSTLVNSQAYEVTNGRIVNTAEQTSSTESRARSGVVLHYSPSPVLVSAAAGNNSYTSTSTDRGSQEHTVTQTSSGRTEAYVSLNGGNLWHSATEADARGNAIVVANSGGSLVAETVQSNSGQVQATSTLTGYEYGLMDSTAYGVGNVASMQNNDIYVRLDNSQINSGGVDVTASFEGAYGYDTYVTADAVGNQVIGSACGDCGADMIANNNQVNSAAISARSDARVTGSGRSTVTTSRATGNSASYYVSGSR